MCQLVIVEPPTYPGAKKCYCAGAALPIELLRNPSLLIASNPGVSNGESGYFGSGLSLPLASTPVTK